MPDPREALRQHVLREAPQKLPQSSVISRPFFVAKVTLCASIAHRRALEIPTRWE